MTEPLAHTTGRALSQAEALVAKIGAIQDTKIPDSAYLTILFRDSCQAILADLVPVIGRLAILHQAALQRERSEEQP